MAGSDDSVPSLLTLIQDADEETFLRHVFRRFPEAQHLLDKSIPTPEGPRVLRPHSLTHKLFGDMADEGAIEVECALVGLRCLRHVVRGEYLEFTECQQVDEATRLTRGSFISLRVWTMDFGLRTERALELLVYMVVCGDLGKTHFIHRCYNRLFASPDAADKVNHDQRFVAVLRRLPDVLPGFQRFLHKESQERLLTMLSTNLNFAQFIQGESVPMNLRGLYILSAQNIVPQFLLAAFYEMAGAAGHKDSRGSVVMTEPTFQNFLAAREIVEEHPVQSAGDAKAIYQLYMRVRGDIIPDLVLADPMAPDAFAQARIAAMSLSNTQSEGTVVKLAWAALPEEDRATLTDELNRDGFDSDKPALVVTCASKMMRDAVESQDGVEGMKAGLRKLAAVFRKTQDRPEYVTEV